MPPSGMCLAALVVAVCLASRASAGALRRNPSLAPPLFAQSGLRPESHSPDGGGDKQHGAGAGVPTDGGGRVPADGGAKGLRAAVGDGGRERGGRDAAAGVLHRRHRSSAPGQLPVVARKRKRRGTWWPDKVHSRGGT